MKTRNLMLGAVALVTLAATHANAQIALSRHNFSSSGWSGGEICKPCHTPHNGNTDVGFLWNHALTTATYNMHEGSNLDTTHIDSRSRMCLSCHDGTVALDSFGGMTGTNFIGPAGLIGTDLTNDHPIGADAVYPLDGRTGSLQPTTPGSNGSRVGTPPLQLRLRSWNDPADGVDKYVVGCSTCHTVHNSGNYPHMLRFSNASSQLCLTCHIK